ncbi:MAG: GspE/PulE/PilB domain-containing protein, partial [Myxococcaceae bacterium]
MKRMNLGDILLSMGAIDALQLQSALAHQRQWGTPLGRALVQSRFCTQAQLMLALARQAGLPLVDLEPKNLDPALAPLISRKVAEQHRVVPLRVEGRRGEVLVVAIAAPATLAALDAVQAVSRKARVVALLADDDAIERALGVLYRGYAGVETQAVAGRLPAVRRDEQELDLDEVSPPPPARARPVLIYGWAEEAGRKLAVILSSQGISARVCGSVEVLSCRADDVLIAPLPSMEAVLPAAMRFKGRLIVAARNPEAELDRARELGARGIIAAPLDTELLVRAVRRCQR